MGDTLFDIPATGHLTDPMARAMAAVTAPQTQVRHDARDTSLAAATKALGRSAGWRRRVFDLIAASDGVTDEEIADQLGMNPSTERPRRVELVQAGLIRDSGRRRRTVSGTDAAVWVISDLGKQVAA